MLKGITSTVSRARVMSGLEWYHDVELPTRRSVGHAGHSQTLACCEVIMNHIYRQPFNLDPGLIFQSPLLVDLHRYWRQKRPDRAMPRRADIDPLDPGLRPHLGFVVLTDVVEPARFRFRLIGSALTTTVGRDSTGKYLDDVYSPEDYEYMIGAYRWVVAHRAPLRVTGNLRHENRSWIDMESLDLPLSSDGRIVDMIMTRSVLSRA